MTDRTKIKKDNQCDYMHENTGAEQPVGPESSSGFLWCAPLAYKQNDYMPNLNDGCNTIPKL